MRKLIAISLLAICLSTSASAGDVPFPGAVPSPTPQCTENCPGSPPATNGATATEGELQVWFSEILLGLVTLG